MQQLSAMDSNFLQQESARTPMHFSLVIVYDQSRRKAGKVRFEDILATFAHNLHRSVVFRRKLAGGAMGLDTPYWIEDRDFFLEFHVRHLALPRPGDWRQFCILLARLHSRGLDMKRPLWEAHVIEGLNRVEGLPKDSFAIMLKIHHSAMDGVSGAGLIQAIHSLNEGIATPVVDDWQGENAPAPWQVWSRACFNNLRRPARLVGTVGALVPNIVRTHKHSAKPVSDWRETLTAKTRFNVRVSPSRVTDALIIDLAEVKTLRKALNNVTINDIVVTVIGGALRNYLVARGELPRESLVAAAPVNVRSERGSTSSGNQMSLMRIDTGSSIADPLERLDVVHASARQAKAFSSAMGADVVMNISETLTPAMLGWGIRVAMLAAEQSERAMPCQVVISNVPGPQMPLYFAGARAHLMMGIGPLLDLIGLFHAVMSGAGHIVINFVSSRQILPDPDFYKTCLENSYQQLRLAAGPASSQGGRTTRRTSTTARPKSNDRKGKGSGPL